MENLSQSNLNKKLEQAKALARGFFEIIPIGSTPRMNIVDVATRTHELIAGTFPPAADVAPHDDLLPVIHPVSNRTEAELGWDDMGTYYDGPQG